MIIFDEKKYALRMLEDGIINKRDFYHDIMILAKYLFHIGKDMIQVKSDVNEFCDKFMKNFNKFLFAKEINKVISIARSSSLRDNPKVELSREEYDYINTIENNNTRKLFFVIYVLYKLYNNNAFEIGLEELFRYAQIKANQKSKYEMLNYLFEAKYINVTVGLKYFVENKFSHSDGNVICEITDFENMIYYYYILKGENVKYCTNCGVFIKPNSNRQKYCVSCAKKIHNSKQSASSLCPQIENA